MYGNLDELTDYLNKDHHPDTWAEYALDYGGVLLGNFTGEEWDKLIGIWTCQSMPWQLRLIDILYSAASERKYEILEPMVLTTEDPIRRYAVEALELNKPSYKIPDHIANHLRSLQQSGISRDFHEMIIALLSHQNS